MRIRSIKPEFWRSDDITPLPLSTRLTFVGLWSYVDDNGVGADKLVSIVADLYADDFSSDPQETVQRVTEDLKRITSNGLVVRYRGIHNGSTKDLLYITKWKEHQKVNHPSFGHKYPLPPAEMVAAAASLKLVSDESLETLPHEQGNRGSGAGEQGSGGTGDEEGRGPALEPPVDWDDAPETEVVVAEPAVVEISNRPPKRNPSSAAMSVVRQELGTNDYPRATIERLAVQAQKLYRAEHPDRLIRESIREWDRRPNSPLPEFLESVYGDVVKAARTQDAITPGEAKVLNWAALGDPEPARKAIDR